MDSTLKELIDKIKTEGVKSAESQSEQILKDAEKKAAAIISEAKSKAAAEREQAKVDIAKREAASNASLKQAGRDLLLTMEKKVTALFDSVVKSQVDSAMTGDTLKDAIVTVVKNWKNGEVAELDVLLSEEQLKKLESSLTAELSAELKKGVEIKIGSSVNNGFQIGEKDGSAFYNFTSEGLAETISEYLNPKLSQIIRESVKDKE
ncbi:hypothetical protein [Spirochaeta cellobiosiphila]|uniref:hypothetical protein n=1 Tax=Spirochaeta cellobiosiphila TaxID=504483 RepID=UPI0003FC9707|nr:hypothetical protein [Spirochaeta cellobiosiphila]